MPRRNLPPATQTLARTQMPEAAALFVRHGPDARDPKGMLQHLGALLNACNAHARRPDPQKPSTTAIVLAALQVHMASQNSDGPPEPMSLAEIKALLMERPPALTVPGTSTQAIENANLLRPLFLLNATKPRTAVQRQQAAMRQAERQAE